MSRRTRLDAQADDLLHHKFEASDLQHASGRGHAATAELIVQRLATAISFC